MAESLKHKTFKGTLWSALERFSVQGIGFIVMVIMARILTPADYGLVGLITIFLSVSQSLVDSGFSQALIRKQDRSQVDNSTVLYFNVIVGGVIYVILYFSAPLIAEFYREPILVTITRLLSLSIVINSFVVVQRALLSVELDFNTQARASMTAAVVSGAVGITMAYSGFGVWSIVWYQLTNLTVNVSLLWILSKWRPSLVFSWASFWELFNFGSKLALSGLIDTIYRNMYLLVIGKVFKATDLGYYTRANQFADLPSSNVTGILQRVTYPVLCHMQDDLPRLRTVYRKFLRVSAFIIFPLMCGLSAMSKPLILLVLKEQWLFTATLLSILSLGMMWYPVHAINLNLLQVRGRSDLFLRLEIVKKIVGVTILIVSIPWGLIWMCVGIIINSMVALVINTHYTGKLINVGFITQMKDLFPVLVTSLLAGAVVYAEVSFIPMSNLWALCVGSLTGIGIYAGIAYIFRFPELGELKSIINNK